jgi:cyclopropane fatty-acyl-phospholipid synthase-like methyltransferase
VWEDKNKDVKSSEWTEGKERLLEITKKALDRRCGELSLEDGMDVS